MRVNRLAVEAIVLGVLLLATVLHAVADAPPVAPGGRSVDSTTVDRLSREALAAPRDRIRATTVESGTLAATLAADLLLGQIDYAVNLPAILK